jgi:hypothetical protein
MLEQRIERQAALLRLKNKVKCQYRFTNELAGHALPAGLDSVRFLNEAESNHAPSSERFSVCVQTQSRS